MPIEHRCAFTGHRPESFAFGSNESAAQCVRIKKQLADAIEQMIKKGVTTFISGAARGVDMWAMEAVLAEKARNPDIHLIAAIPHRSQPNSWRESEQRRYHSLLAACDHTVLLSENYYRGCLLRRNCYMVDNAAHLIAVYNGSETSGTAHTVRYAKKLGRDVTIISPSLEY